jgi:hypothetical protein
MFNFLIPLIGIFDHFRGFKYSAAPVRKEGTNHTCKDLDLNNCCFCEPIYYFSNLYANLVSVVSRKKEWDKELELLFEISSF